MVFHPHNWIKPEQINELIDHAVTKHGKKVKFLNFREAVERLNKNVLSGKSLRRPDGTSAGWRIADLDSDGFVDTLDDRLIPNYWQPKTGGWRSAGVPITKIQDDDGRRHSLTVQNGAVAWGAVSDFHINNAKPMITTCDFQLNLEHFDGPNQFSSSTIWARESTGNKRAKLRDLWFFDIDNDGTTEMLVEYVDPADQTVRLAASYWNGQPTRLVTLPVPAGSVRAGSTRFIDIDDNGDLDIVFSNHERYGIWLWDSKAKRWSREVLSGQRGDKPAEQELPPIVRADGSNNGFWVHARQLVWMNEDTAKSKDLVERRSFDDILARRLGTPARLDAKSAPEDNETKEVNAKEATGKSAHPPNDGPKSPEESLKLMQVKPGYRVELVAAEPLVRDPVAFDWGPDGKLWVAEMADYPLGVGEGEEADNADADLR